MNFKIIPFIIILLLFSAFSCNRGKDFVLIVDISGSMRENNQIDKVKRSIIKVLLNYEKGDRVFLFTFDSKTNLLLETDLKSNEDLEKINNALDTLGATGPWTNLIGALDSSLQTVIKLKEEEPDRKTTLILYTDGKHDLPRNHKDNKHLNFDSLFEKYYKNYSPNKKSWFIYYVELEKLDTDLKNFLVKTKSGKVIEKKTFESFKNFTIEPLTLSEKMTMFLKYFAILFALYLIFYFFKPWFKNLILSHVAADSVWKGAETFDLEIVRKPFFRTSVTIGSKGKIEVEGSDVSEKHARIGVSLGGSVYIKPIKDNKLKINDRLIDSKKFIFPGDQIQIGASDLVLQIKPEKY